MENLLLGVDVGTTATKAVLVDYNGKLVSQGRVEHPTFHVKTGWVEQDSNDWWKSFCGSVAIAKQGAPNSNITAVLISSQAPTLLAVDEKGEQVRRAMIWMDRRAEEQAQELHRKFTKISEMTGNRADPYYVAAKIKWLIDNEPDNYKKTKYFLQIPGFLNFKLTGKFGIDGPHASMLQLRTADNSKWIPEVLDFVGVSEDRFPVIGGSTEKFAEVTSNNESGIPAGTPVFFGAVDGCSAAVEAGAIDPGTVAEMSGTSTVLLMPTDGQPFIDEFVALEHSIPNRQIRLGAMVSSGASIQWLQQNIFKSHTSLDDLTVGAEKVKAGCNGLVFLPYMMGERSPIWNSNARGVFFGLTLGTTPEAMFRSVLEGTAFTLAHNVEVAKKAGIKVNEIRSIGGATKSGLWNQIKADVLGMPVLTIQESVGASLGDAYLAGLGLGVFKDIQEPLKKNLVFEKTYEPNMKAHGLYKEQFAIFRSIYESTRTELDKLAQLADSEIN